MSPRTEMAKAVYERCCELRSALRFTWIAMRADIEAVRRVWRGEEP